MSSARKRSSRKRVHASALEPEVHAQLELTDRGALAEQVQLVFAPAVAVTPAIVGDVVTVAGELAVVRERCDAAPVKFFCLPCHQPLANAYQLELHTSDGTHCIARQCDFHGLETP